MTLMTMAYRGGQAYTAKIEKTFTEVLLKTDPFQTATNLVVIRERDRWYSIEVPC